MRRGRLAFSLIELIVVIGIIAILVGLLMPTLSMVRDHAKQIKCATQLRQVGQGLANYAAQFKGAYPTCSNWHVYGGDGTGEDEAGPAWTEQLEPYFAKVKSGIYLCPAFDPETEYNYFLGIHYIMVAQQRMDLRTSDIGISSNYILSGDCTHARLYPPPWGQAQLFLYTNDCDKDDARWKCLSFFGEEYGRNAHRSGNNVLFGDYHVAPYRKFEPSDMTYDPRKPGIDFDQVQPEQQ
jgi:prepilin-type N-terminal cleavage/methylation domain-containing protein